MGNKGGNTAGHCGFENCFPNANSYLILSMFIIESNFFIFNFILIILFCKFYFFSLFHFIFYFILFFISFYVFPISFYFIFQLQACLKLT